MHAPADREEVRRQFHPGVVKMLFVGESPPAAGGFFYFGNGILFTATREAFASAWQQPFQTPAEFLRAFAAVGCYLEDLSHAPVDHFIDHDRCNILQGCVTDFGRQLREMSPQLVIIILIRIEPFIRQAAALAGITAERVRVLPFPGHGNYPRYLAGLKQLLMEAQTRGIIAPLSKNGI